MSTYTPFSFLGLQYFKYYILINVFIFYYLSFLLFFHIEPDLIDSIGTNFEGKKKVSYNIISNFVSWEANRGNYSTNVPSSTIHVSATGLKPKRSNQVQAT